MTSLSLIGSLFRVGREVSLKNQFVFSLSLIGRLRRVEFQFDCKLDLCSVWVWLEGWFVFSLSSTERLVGV